MKKSDRSSYYRKLADTIREQGKAERAVELRKIKNTILAVQATYDAKRAGYIGSGTSMNAVRDRLGKVTQRIHSNKMSPKARESLKNMEKRLRRRVHFAPLPQKESLIPRAKPFVKHKSPLTISKSLVKHKSPLPKTLRVTSKPRVAPRWK